MWWDRLGDHHSRDRGWERDQQAGAVAPSARQADEQSIARALQGNWREEHLFVLSQALALFDAYQIQVGDCDKKLESLLQGCSVTPVRQHQRRVEPRMLPNSTCARRCIAGAESISPASTA
jgi:hypothetical protein